MVGGDTVLLLMCDFRDAINSLEKGALLREYKTIHSHDKRFGYLWTKKKKKTFWVLVYQKKKRFGYLARRISPDPLCEDSKDHSIKFVHCTLYGHKLL